MDKKEFKERIYQSALLALDKLQIDPLITMTQAAHESNWGNSGLTDKANNLFGYTANQLWKEANKPMLAMQTTEYSHFPPDKVRYWNTPGDIVEKIPHGTGSKLTVTVMFRKYENWDESVLDWAKSISKLERYAAAYGWAKEGKLPEYARSVQMAGYATDPTYAEKLILVGKIIQGI